MSSIKRTFNLKTIFATILAVCIMACPLSGCSTQIDWILKAGDYQFGAGEYLYIVLEQVFNAQSKAGISSSSGSSVKNEEVMNMTIEGKKGYDWVKDESVKEARGLLASRIEFDNLNLSLTDEEKSTITSTVDKYYPSLEQYYEISKIGVSKESFTKYMEDRSKKSKVSEEYFGEGKSMQITDAKKDEYSKAHGARYKVVEIDKNIADNKTEAAEGEEGEPLITKNESMTTAEQLADKYFGDIGTGKSIDDVNAALYKALEQPETTLEYKFLFDDDTAGEKEAVFETEAGGSAVLKEGENAYYIVQRYEIDQSTLEAQRTTAETKATTEESTKLYNDILDKAGCEQNDGAIAKYDPMKQAKMIDEKLSKTTQGSY